MSQRAAAPAQPAMHSQDAADVWTVVHHLYGAYFCSVFRMSWRTTVMIAVLWEIIENTTWGVAMWGDDTYGGDSLVNAVVDVLATASGWAAAHFH